MTTPNAPSQALLWQEERIAERAPDIMPHIGDPQWVVDNYCDVSGLAINLENALHGKGLSEEKRREYQKMLDQLDTALESQNKKDQAAEDAARAIAEGRKNVRREIGSYGSPLSTAPVPDLDFSACPK